MRLLRACLREVKVPGLVASDLEFASKQNAVRQMSNFNGFGWLAGGVPESFSFFCFWFQVGRDLSETRLGLAKKRRTGIMVVLRSSLSGLSATVELGLRWHGPLRGSRSLPIPSPLCSSRPRHARKQLIH